MTDQATYQRQKELADKVINEVRIFLEPLWKTEESRRWASYGHRMVAKEKGGNRCLLIEIRANEKTPITVSAGRAFCDWPVYSREGAFPDAEG